MNMNVNMNTSRRKRGSNLRSNNNNNFHLVAVVLCAAVVFFLQGGDNNGSSTMAFTTTTTTTTTTTGGRTNSIIDRHRHGLPRRRLPRRRHFVVLHQSSNVKILENNNNDMPTTKASSGGVGTDDDKYNAVATTMGPTFKDYLPTATTTTTKKADDDDDDNVLDEEYKKGFAIIGFITLLNASLAPVWHTVFNGTNTPPPLFLNAVVSIVAFIGLLVGSPFLDSKVETTSALAATAAAATSSSEDDKDGCGSNGGVQKWSTNSFRGGMELGLWKGLGTTCHIYGMALTTANHGAFLLQLTTLIVPVLQGIRGERIPMQIQLAVGLALGGIVAFTQDPSGAAGASDVALDPAQVQMGDALVLGAAFFYSLYDIQTFYWGREVPRTELVTIKVGFQAFLSVILCAVVASDDVMQYIADGPDYTVMVPTVLWSGLIVNALATFLQVGGMQSVGPTRAQTIFASQPLWASILNFVFIGEMVGTQGLLGGGAFLGALFLAATAEAPKPVQSTTTSVEVSEPVR